MMIIKRRATQKCNLITDLMKEEFERKLLKEIDFSKPMEEIDRIATPMIEQFFKECEVISDIYGQEYEDDMDDTSMVIQRRNCLNRVAGLALENFTLETLRTTNSVEDLDAVLTAKMDEFYKIKKKIFDFYAFE